MYTSCSLCMESDHREEECSLQMADSSPKIGGEPAPREGQTLACFAWNDGRCHHPACLYRHCGSDYAVKYANTTSLLVVPTISLKQDLGRRAENLGVSCSHTPNSVTREPLVIVTPEAVVQGSEVTKLLRYLCTLMPIT